MEPTGKIKLLAGVVSAHDAPEVTRLCNASGAALSYSFECRGTARTAVLDYLGIGETARRMVLSLIPEAAETAVMEAIQKEMSLYLVGKGICFTLPLTSASSIVAGALLKSLPKDSAGRDRRMERKNTLADKLGGKPSAADADERTENAVKKREYELIVAAVQSGYADDAMTAAREAGASGGTLIHAMTLDNRKAEQLIGVRLQEETEILTILTRRETREAIMRAIQRTAGLKTDAGGVLFSLPVDNLVGVGAASD